MQFDINVQLGASPELISAINNIAASFATENTITRAARKSRTSAAPAAAVQPDEVPAAVQPDEVPAAVQPDEVPAAVQPEQAPPGNSATAVPPLETASAPKGAANTAPPSLSEPPPGQAPTVVDVRAAIAALAKNDKPRALAILAKHGAGSVSALKPEAYAAVLAEVVA